MLFFIFILWRNIIENNIPEAEVQFVDISQTLPFDDETFDVIVAENHVQKSKPDPEGILMACQKLEIGHDSLIYVGDAVSDIQAGKNAGAFTVAYLSMPERRQAMMDEKPNRAIDDLMEIVELVKEDHSWTHNMM